ncbi:hypothetical protein GOODEAATRI_024534 [Goodea atripinnis]|uniref:Zinc finger protein 318 n=1 Tax=Goodea atripinnis TaxID=208336 RepID=A0ABV0NXF0_9TELE
MFRGRPPFRGYPPPPRPHPSPGYRDDRARPRLPYHQDYPEYRDHGAPDSYRRRYPSPGYGGHLAGDFWAGGPPPEISFSDLLSSNRCGVRSAIGMEVRFWPVVVKPLWSVDLDPWGRAEEEVAADVTAVRRSDSPGDLDRTMSRVADQLLQAVKLNDPHAVAAVLSELRSDPQMSQRANLNNEIKEILNLLGVSEPASGVPQRVVDEIDDEEKFLYGELEEPKTLAAPEPVRHHSLDLYGDVTEDSLYSDPPSQRAVVSQVYSCPPTISPQLQAPPTVSEINTYMSRPSISADQNVTVQVPNPAYPPGTEPLEESERQALEEYEKIQDLLKTIGLDLGVGEISKMAARTKERLHGNKQPPKTPTRRRHYSSGSSDGSCHSRGHRRPSQSVSSSSSSRSRGRGTKRGGSWSSEDHEPKKSTSSKTPKHWEVKDSKSEWSTPTPPQISDPSPIPTHTSLPIPTYPPPQLPGVMPPNYPPPGYGQYGNYLPYMHQQWPPMYPPPNMVLPHQTATDDPLPPPTYKKPYNKLTLEAGSKGEEPELRPGLVYCDWSLWAADSLIRLVQEVNITNQSEAGVVVQIHQLCVWSSGVVRSICQEEQRRSQDQKVSDEQNNESEKLKPCPVSDLHRDFCFQHVSHFPGELLRKKRREKDGHKDPLLQEINRLQEEVMAQISNLRKEHEAAEKKRSEIEKVALILGLSPSDRPSKISKQPKNQDQEEWPPQKEKREQERSPEEQPAASSSAVKVQLF